jgi:hypothetical protein
LIAVGHPAWLSGLLLVPAVWWLHRTRGHGAPLPVASLLLWEIDRETGEAAVRAQHADPAWRRRALLVGLLSVALAAPLLTLERQRVIVWLDDGLSMMTREPGGQQRWQLGIAQVRQLASSQPGRAFSLRTLGGARAPLPLDRLSSLRPRAAEGDLPATGTLDKNSEHWLVTDGTDADLATWAARAGIARVLIAGSATENVALLALAARPDLKASSRLALEVTVANNGTSAATRTLELSAGRELLMRRTLQLRPDELLHARLDIARPEAAIEARLSPGDALELDDSLALQPASFERTRVGVPANCGVALRNAIAAHPQFAIADTGSAALRVACGADSATPAGAAQLTVLQAGKSRVLTGDKLWSQTAIAAGMAVPLPAGLQAYDTKLAVGPAEQVLLWAGNEPLATVATAPIRQVRTVLDLEDAAVSRQPEYALLVATLLDSLSGQAQLDKVARVAFDRAATRIAPARRPVAATPARAHRDSQSVDLTAWLLAAALCVLAWDILATARQSRAIRRFTAGA